jgi:flagellar motor protein MotB
MSANEIRDFSHFLLWEQASRDAIMVKRVYIDMAGDVIAGLMLSQIIYWHLPNSEGRTRLRVIKDGHLWLAKSHTEWWEECRLTVDQARRALKILQDKSLVVTALKRFNGAPTVHIRMDQEHFLDELNRFGLQPKSIRDKTQIELAQNPYPFGSQPESYKQTLQTDTTTDITTAAEQTRSRVSAAPVASPKRRQVGRKTAAAVSVREDEETSDPETLALIEFLLAADLNRVDAERFAKMKPEEARRQLEYLPFKTSLENPGGYLRRAIEGGFPPPKEYRAAKAKEERERKKRVEDEQKQAQEAAQRAAEAAKALRLDDSIARLEIEAPASFTAFCAYVERERRKTQVRCATMSPSIQARMLKAFHAPEKRREMFAAWHALPEDQREQQTTQPQETTSLFRYEADKPSANGSRNPSEVLGPEGEEDRLTIASLIHAALSAQNGE